MKVIKLQMLFWLGVVPFNPALSQQNLQLPDTLSGSLFNLNIRDTSKVFFTGFSTATYGINADYLGPVLFLNKGDSIQFHVTNYLSDTTTLHWHGLHVSPQNDGGPHVTILPGATWSPTFTVRDQASTHWYHPHLHMMTNKHVSGGAAGMIIVRDSMEATLSLPRTYGIDDFPLIVQTKAFDASKQITYDNPYDSTIVVNGTIDPILNAPAQVIRLRILNAASERVFNIGFQGNLSYNLIGTDGGLLDAPVLLNRLSLSPGERAEILLDLGNMNGQTLDLISFSSQLPNAVYGASQPGMGPGQVIPGYSLNPLNGSDFRLIRIQVQPAVSNPITSIPTSLVPANPIPPGTVNTTRSLTFMPMNMGPTAIQGPFMINNQMYDMNTINFTIPLGNTEIWTLTNQTPIAHPFHIHNTSFTILDVNGVPPPAHLAGKKDVVLVPAGMGTVRFIARFEDFCDSTYPYMYHCHMLPHEDHGMMGQFIVACPTNTGDIEVQNHAQIKILPNPAYKTIRITNLPDGEITEFLIVDILGISIKSGSLSPTQNSISVTELPPGTYLIRLNGKDWSNTLRWIREE